MFIVALFKIAQNWKKPKCLSTGEAIKCGTGTQRNTVCNKKEQIFDTCYMIDEPQKHDAKKPDTRDHRLHLYEISKKVKSTEIENRLVAAWGRGWE